MKKRAAHAFVRFCAIITLSFGFLVGNCDAGDAKLDGITKKITKRLHKAGGSLEKLAYKDCPKGLRDASFTHIPKVDWSKVKRVQAFSVGARGPGKGPKTYAMNWDSGTASYRNMLCFDVPIEVETSDGKIHHGLLSLRPLKASGSNLQILPPSGKSNAAAVSASHYRNRQKEK